MLEKLRNEWPTIKAAPWSVATIGSMLIAAGFAFSSLLSAPQVRALQAERDLLKSSLERQAAGQQSPMAPPRRSAGASQPKRLEVPAPPDASYAPKRVAERYLGLKAERATPLQLNQLLAPYAGKRIRFVGRLVNAEMRDGSVWVQLAPPADGDSIFVTFAPRWAGQLSSVAPTATIGIDALIGEIDALIGEGEPPALVDGSLL